MEEIFNIKNLREEHLVNLHVAVILGSTSDTDAFEKSKLRKIFKALGVNYIVVALSAHRHHDELEKFCKKAKELNEWIIFIGAAGLSAALPGNIKAIAGSSIVFGVPLDREYALPSMIAMPEGIPVLVTSVGPRALTNAALSACEILSFGASPIISRQSFENYKAEVIFAEKSAEFLERSP